ncbi:MAG: sensor histidine kinase [Deltaproteobacteria bacterium]|nr:sensor histidine kinase [Deltaproteobacteria bacterium]MBW1952530.1 sensor histidine kinase [Deltaproteobacteria bacterium]MBW1987291.1 sensor histidine kinase [Deltaproteobacteria bacterium]MBW2135149.1 sensor histidine kinase [Deltaproteobacteria bacterium]
MEPTDLDVVRQRVQEKKKSFQEYNFGRLQDDAIKTFFDLSQEYETLENLYRVCITVIKEFFDRDSRLCLVSSDAGRMEYVCDSLTGLQPEMTPPPPYIYLSSTTYEVGSSWIIPIRGNRLLVERLPFFAKDQVIGMLEIFPVDGLSESDKFFFEKYTNRLGYCLNNKIILWQNIQHIRFINSLVADIEHNVITPNISLTLYLRHLKKKIMSLHDLCRGLPTAPAAEAKAREIAPALQELIQGIEEDFQNLEKHYQGISLYLESLFRPSHFEKGHFVLRRRTCNVRSEIIAPQLELFLPKFRERQIEIDESLGGVPEEDLTLSVDKGLIAQVYANLFSNAVKYTRPSPSGRKYVSFGRQLVKDFFGPGKDGIRFNVFSSGPHVPPPDIEHIFDEGYRGSNIGGEVGTGRGLYFMRNVIETHGGQVGYEPTSEGNDFYFILPVLGLEKSPERS